LDARRRTLAVQETRDAGQKLDVRRVPDSEVVRCDAPARFHRRGFHANQPGAAHGAAAKMHQVPIGGEPVFGGVLAHGRNRDPVAQSDLADGERRHQMRYWEGTHSLSMAAEGGAQLMRNPPFSPDYSDMTSYRRIGTWLGLAILCAGTARGAGPSYSAAGIVNASNYAVGPFAPNSV